MLGKFTMVLTPSPLSFGWEGWDSRLSVFACTQGEEGEEKDSLGVRAKTAPDPFQPHSSASYAKMRARRQRPEDTSAGASPKSKRRRSVSELVDGEAQESKTASTTLFGRRRRKDTPEDPGRMTEEVRGRLVKEPLRCRC
jgi:hypothetical protein